MNAFEWLSTEKMREREILYVHACLNKMIIRDSELEKQRKRN